MLLMVNGRLVGGMTEVGLEVELELSGQVMYLAVAQYKHARITSSQRASLEMQVTSATDEALRDERVVGWREIGYGEHASLPLDYSSRVIAGNGAPDEPEEVSMAVRTAAVENSGTEERPDYGGSPLESQKQAQSTVVSTAVESQVSLPDASPVDPPSRAESSDDKDIHDQMSSQSVDLKQPKESHHDLVQRCILDRHVVSCSLLNGSAYSSGSEDAQSMDGNDEDSQQWENDNNAWNGCVCGVIHKASQSRLFWIQCEFCHSWYDVAERCVGFSEEQAQKLGQWICWACADHDDDEACRISPSSGHVLSGARSCSQGRSSEGPSSKRVALSSSEEVIHFTRSHTDFQPQSSAMDFGDTQKEAGFVPSPSSKETSTGHKLDDMFKQKESTRNKTRTAYIRRRPLQRTPQGDLISNSKPQKLENGTFKRPPGKAPDGFRWDNIRCLWTPIADDKLCSVKNPVSSPNTSSTGPNLRQSGRGRSRKVRGVKTRDDGAQISTAALVDGKAGKPNGLLDPTLRHTVDSERISYPRPVKLDDGTFERPPGREPNGYVWDKHRCAWRPALTSGNKRTGSARTKRVNQEMGRTTSMSQKSSQMSNGDGTSNLSLRRSKPYTQMEELKGNGDVHLSFELGAMVDVIPHSWPTVNHVGGIGTVVKAYVDDDGKKLYDIKYPVSRHTEKRIYAEWIKACFL